MHAIIAASSTHLVTVVPDNKSYKLTEAYHWHETTTQYTQELSHINPSNMDIMLSTCLLLTLNTFPLPDYNPRASFVFSPFPSNSLSWLSLQSGLRHLLSIINPWLRESLWFDTFMASRGDPDVFEDSRRGRVGLHPGLADLCQIGDDTADENPYWLPLRVLTPMLKLHPCAENLGRFTNFMGRLVPSFFEVLVRKETPALVVLAWWLGIMGKVDMWWARKRVWSEVYGICMFLEEEGRLDGRVRELMRFPAVVCGFSFDCPR